MSTPIRQLVLSLFFAFLILSGPFSFAIGPGVGAQSLQSCGSCAGVGLSGDLGEDDGAAGLDLGYPVDIPAPIAKGIEGIDASSITFTPSGGSLLVKNSLSKNFKALTGIVGTIAGHLKNTSLDVNVAVIINGEIVTILTTQGGVFEYSVDAVHLDQPIAFAVLNDEQTQVSYPVIVTVLSGNQLTISINITNEGEGSGVDIQPNPMAFNGEDIFYVARDGDAPLVGSVSIQGGASEVASSDPAVLFSGLTIGTEGHPFGIDSTDFLVYAIAEDMTLSLLGDSSIRDTSRVLSVSPNGQWLATTSTVNSSKILSLIEVATGEQFPAQPDSDESQVTDLTFEWLNNNALKVLKRRANNAIIFETYDVSDIVNGTGADVSTVNSRTLSSTTRNPISNRLGEGSTIWAECEGDDDYFNLCQAGEGEITTVINEDYHVKRARYSVESGCVVYEADPNLSVETDNRIGIFDPSTGNYELLTKGLYPEIYSDGNFVLISYLYLDSTGEFQVSILKRNSVCTVLDPVDGDEDQDDDQDEEDPVDTTAPSVSSVSPASGATGVSTDPSIYARFTEPMDMTNVSGNAMVVRDNNASADVRMASTIQNSTDVVSLNNDNDYLCPLTSHTVTVDSTVHDLSDNELGSDYTWSFTTGDAAVGGETGYFTFTGAAIENPRMDFNSSGNGMAVYIVNSRMNASTADLSGPTSNPVVLDNGGGATSDPQVAINASGNAIAAWVQGGADVWGMYYTASTNTWSMASVLSATPASDPAVAISSSGKAVVTWEETDNIKYAVNTGSAWTASNDAEFVAGATTAPDVVFINATQFMVALGQNTGANVRPKITDFTINADNTFTTGSINIINNALAQDISDIHISSDGAGKAYVAYKSEDALTIVSIYGNLYSGLSWGATNDFGGIAAGGAAKLDLAMNSSGDAVLAWTVAPSSLIKGNVMNGTTNTWGTTTTISDVANTGPSAPSVDIDAQGHALVAWYNTGDDDVWTNRFIDGTGWSTATARTSGTNNNLNPWVALTPCGNGMILYDREDTTNTVQYLSFY